MSILKTNKLTKKFQGVYALRHLSIGIQKNSITGIVGPNGSGKSTLINVLSGVLAFNSGFLEINDRTLEKKVKSYLLPQYGLTRTFQEVRLFDQMSVEDNLLLALKQTTKKNNFSKKQEEDFLKKLLEQVNLLHKRTSSAGNLSYGQRKLLEVARAMAMDSEVILLDEPFAGLFPEMINSVVEILRALKNRGVTIVLIEHNMNIIKDLCDHLIVLDSGELLAEGRPSQVLNRREVIEAYLGE